MRLILLSLLCLPVSWAGALKGLVVPTTYSINNTSQVDINNPLPGARTVQVYIRPSSTEQVYTLTLPDGGTIEIGAGGSFTIKSEKPINTQEPMFSVQTGTGAAVLQVVALKDPL